MKKFSDLGISTPADTMIGEKVKISKVLNREITVLKHRIDDTKYPKNKTGKCLCLQIRFDNEIRVVFTGSDVLINMIRQVKPEDFPFTCSIVKEGEHFEFK